MNDRSPHRDPAEVEAMLRRLDHRVWLVVIAVAILALGTAAFYIGVPLVWGERVPLAVCVIPPSIFAMLVAVMAVANVRQVGIARRLLVDGEVMGVARLAWTVFAFGAPGDLRDPRPWSLPASGAGVSHDIELDLLDTHHDWMPRQSRTVSVWLEDETRLTIWDIPARIGAADLRSAILLRLSTRRGPVHGVAVRGAGLFLASP